MDNIWKQINDTVADTVSQVRQSLVQIIGTEGNLGAGTIWHEDGLIVTNAHVVSERGQKRSISVGLQNGERYPATVLIVDEDHDIAALAIAARGLPTIKIGSSRSLRVGQWLMAIGHPWGVLDALTAGVVIGTGDRLPEVNDQRDWIALDMKMRPGHSGGPLFNLDGEIVGINTMIRGPEVSFAVPVDIVKRTLKDTLGTYHPPTLKQPITAGNRVIV